MKKVPFPNNLPMTLKTHLWILQVSKLYCVLNTLRSLKSRKVEIHMNETNHTGLMFYSIFILSE